MKLLLTGASGFVGSNIHRVLRESGDEVVTERVDMTDTEAVAAYVERTKPDAIIHCAIMNDWDQMMADRRAAWAAYVDATRNYAEAATANNAHFTVVSTDWVFDGTQAPATEDTPPNPVNLYGFLKAASEIIAIERGGAVARVSGVQGPHLARPNTPRVQDPGFGYLVASMVDAISAGNPFTVWEADDINMYASPSVATMCGEVMRAMAEQNATGIYHCNGAATVSRRELAEAAVDAFTLDRSLLSFGPPPEGVAFTTIPHNTGLDATATAERLGTPLPELPELLARLKHDLELNGQ